MFVKTDYTSNDVAIPDTFLTGPPAKPVVSTPIDWANTPLPENKGRVAFVVDNILSQEECAQLLSLAEASVPNPAEDGASPWKPAMIAVSVGVEILAKGYRESDRIVWDQQVVADRIAERILQAEGVRELLGTVPEPYLAGEWKFRGVNERMRFLKYSAGQFFKPHTDASYRYGRDGVSFVTQYTIQLYLNDSAAADPTSELVGGATAFLSRDRKADPKKARVDVNPKAGSALVFQVDGLYHEGALLEAGVKYTIRMELLYELVGGKEEKEEEKSVKKGWWE